MRWIYAIFNQVSIKAFRIYFFLISRATMCQSFLLHVREVPPSNYGPDTISNKVYGFPQYLQENAGMLPEITS
jgi:hypothetical protein